MTKRNTTAAAGTIGLLCVATMAIVGCSSNKQGATTASNPGVTDISIAPTPLAAEPVAPQPALQPVVSDAPTQAPAPIAAAAPSAAGGKYTVQKGDTLWKIASTSYGDGKQWQKIASANPGLSPSTLKAGQQINIP
jgi:5'-nucleotidase